MDDLIRRQDALDAFGLSEKTRKYGGDHSGYETMMLYEIQDVIEGLPSVSTEKTGRWITVDKGLIVTSYKCSECGRIVRDDTGYDVAEDYPYCHCGAKMQEESESCKGCQNICVMYDPGMKGCKEVEPQESEVPDADSD